MKNSKLMRDEMFHNFIDNAALAPTYTLIDCDEDFQKVEVCRHEENSR
jgi:hypothetical protein